MPKRTSWHNYISNINSKTPMKKIWNMLRGINGKSKSPTFNHVKSNGRMCETKKDIANALGENFKKNSSSSNYSEKFQNIKNEKEKINLNFTSDNEEKYNFPFTYNELEESLQQTSDTAAGPDEIHYQILKHLPSTSLKTLLNIYNHIWSNRTFPKCWTEATIIPIPKPNKDHTEPTNYRPIALTSCVCKVLERIINKRLVWYLETNNLISRYQSGFRKNRSTNDQLVRFETFIRNAFIRKQHVVAIFFDLEKAYDTTWKYGIMKDLHDIGLRGHLPQFISNFLSNRSFNVRVGSTLSDTYEQEQGVPQGSILSPTLFNIKINNIAKCIDDDVDCSLYVDDFLICYRSKYMENIETKLQANLNRIENWALENGFKFSKTKTQCVHFCQQHRLHPDPVLKIYGSQIPFVDEAKFLGLIFDRKLNFISHIKNLKQKCQKALNIMKVLSSTDWGGDKTTLLTLYRSLIRSKLDYGSVVYGSARKSYLKMLDTIHHQGLRLALGAFRTSPVESLYTEASEPPLCVRREKLSLQYITKLAACPQNPAFKDVFQPLYKRFYQNDVKSIKPLGIRTQHILQEANISIDKITPFTFPYAEPWIKKPPEVILNLNHDKKLDTDQVMFKTKFLEIKSKYAAHTAIYTDGSKQEERVACAAVSQHEVLSRRLPNDSSIFSAEASAISLALSYIEDNNHNKFIIFSDSLSVLKSLKNLNHPNPLIQQILNKYRFLSFSKHILFCWIPSHIGIRGNETADQEAKSALNHRITNLKIPYTDFKPQIRIHTNNKCQQLWDSCINNKLHEINDKFQNKNTMPVNRKEQVVLTRCRIGHSRLTHSFLLNNEDQPWCIPCHQVYTIKHILIDCIDLHPFRTRYYNVQNIKELFNNVESKTILEFLKDINVYNKI